MPGGGFHGGGFPGGAGFGINIEDLMRGFGGGGFPGGGFGQQRGFGQQGQGQRQQQRGGQRTYSFSFGGGAPEGMRF